LKHYVVFRQQQQGRPCQRKWGGGGHQFFTAVHHLELGGIGNSSGIHAVIVSPPGGDSAQASEQHEGVICALFNKEINVDDIPSQHICPLMQEPPIMGVYFDVPNRNGDTTNKVFEWSQLYRWIATPGNMGSRQNVSHLINQQFIPRPSAWNLVYPVTTNLQALLHWERQALNLVLLDENPLTDNARLQYDKTMRALVDWFVPFIYLFCILCFATTSNVCLSFFVSLINRREVIADADLSSPSNSESVVEMFSIPPLAQQPQQQCQERLSSSLSNSTNRTRSPSTKGISNAPRRRAPLSPFVFTSNGRTGIWSTNHAIGLIGILQLAGAHKNELIGTLG
jgi:hypothetical protein